MKATDGRVRSRQIRTHDTEACLSARLKTRRNSSNKRTTPRCSVCVCARARTRTFVCVLLRSFRRNAPPSLPACHTIPHPLASSLYLQHAPSVSSSLSPCLKLLSSPIYSMNDFLVSSAPLKPSLHHVLQPRKIPRSEDGWLLEWCFNALMD
jgi:hypothetical protein